MNELEEVGEINTALGRRWGGQGRLVHTMASDLFPVVRADLAKDPELFFLANERLCAAGNFTAAVVGQNSLVALDNPATSGIIATVKRIRCAGGSTTTYLAHFIPENDGDYATLLAAAAGPVAGTPCDGRWRAPSFGACRTFQASTVGPTLGNIIGRLAQLANTPLDFDVPVVLTPGTAVLIYNANTNQDVSGSFEWVERRQVTQERQP